jgi:hypothetical protein
MQMLAKVHISTLSHRAIASVTISTIPVGIKILSNEMCITICKGDLLRYLLGGMSWETAIYQWCS